MFNVFYAYCGLDGIYFQHSTGNQALNYLKILIKLIVQFGDVILFLGFYQDYVNLNQNSSQIDLVKVVPQMAESSLLIKQLQKHISAIGKTTIREIILN